MKKESCALCRGQSWVSKVQGDDVVPYRCACFKRRLALAFLGSELAKAPHRRSPLYQPEVDPETQELMGDRTRDDLFIKGSWDEAAPHLRWAVGARHYDDEDFTFKMVTDEKLLRVFLGDFAYNNRSERVRDEIETFNNLNDLVSQCSLLIVRLGKLGHNNKAAGNVLLETLNIRGAESKATWLIEGTLHFGPGHKFYNDDVGSYIEDNFETINVGGDVDAARKLEAQLNALRTGSAAMDADESDPLPLPETSERFTAEPGAWENPPAYSRPNKWRGASGGRRKAGRLSGVGL